MPITNRYRPRRSRSRRWLTPAGAGAVLRWRPSTSWPALVGVYCWVEQRIFELTGGWADRAGRRRDRPGGRPELEGLLGRGLQAARLRSPAAGPSGCRCGRAWTPARWWRRRPAPWRARSTTLASEPAPAARAGALVGAVLPLLAHGLRAHLRTASPVSEGPVMEVLVEARRESARGDPGRHGRPGWCLGAGLDVAAGLRAGIQRAFEGTPFSLLYAHLDSAITLSPQPTRAGNGRQLQ